MKEKLLQHLKTNFYSMGFGMDLLDAVAETLSQSGLVTEENAETIVKAQKPMLEKFQKESDKRVGQSSEKVKTESKKEYEKQIEELRKAHEVELEKFRNAEKPATAKAEPAPTAAPAPKTELAADTNQPPQWYAAEREATQKQLRELAEANKKLLENLNSMQKETAAEKAKQAAAQRSQFIIDKARELGVPQYRIDEGFAIADTADNDSIVQYLTGVTNNIKAQQLPTQGAGFRLADDTKVDKAAVDNIAKSLIV